MKNISLNGPWQFRKQGEQDWLPASVPGTVHTDLLAAGRIPDPYPADNEKKVQWVAESDWEYRRRFDLPPGLLQEEHVFLVCDGLDTLARVLVNGVEVGQSSNMFIQRRWDVKAQLQEAENEITILFGSPVAYASACQKRRMLVNVTQAIPGGSYLRKSQSQFGWDWGPQLPTSGIWRAIRLEAMSQARIQNVDVRQQHSPGQVMITARVELERWQPSPLSLKLLISSPNGEVLAGMVNLTGSQTATDLQVQIPDPHLWWPNGYGEQPLYQVEIRLESLSMDNGAPVALDTRHYQLGLRTLELRQQPDQWGKSFEFVVNGVPIFAKGANWIPADAFPPRITPEKRRFLLESTRDSHMNMLRVWGGGYYEDENFYELCDQFGILVWQDFMFACAMYPFGDPDFLENVHQEVVQNIRRLRHHACLALWCGNNEMEQGWVEWGWGLIFWLRDIKKEYVRFFHQALPAWVAAEDPERSYWPSSPFTAEPLKAPNHQSSGDAHYWAVWHQRMPFSAYRDVIPRFMSEFGFQSLPSLPTIHYFARPGDLHINSPVMLLHQRSAGGNALILSQMAQHFREPLDFEALVYTSMLLQAEGIRYGVEHWRRCRGRVMGILYWQLNDVWPAASWSSIDYLGIWKALHYYARRFYAPLLLSIEDQQDVMDVHLTNDTLETWQGRLHWSLESLDGKVLDQGDQPIQAAAQADTPLVKLDFTQLLDHQRRQEMVLICELWQADTLLRRIVQPFVHDKQLALQDPGLEVELAGRDGGLAIELRASKGLARYVELSLNGAEPDTIFSDNYFDLPAGRCVEITAPLPAGWPLDQARDRLRVRSLYGGYKQ